MVKVKRKICHGDSTTEGASDVSGKNTASL